MKTVLIADAIDKPWWRNFWQQDPAFYSELNNLQIALAKYNCRYVNFYKTGRGSYLEFDTEQDYVMFILRWS